VNMKCPSQARGLKPWSPVDGAILGDVGNFRRLGLTGGSKSLGEGPGKI
jgi:hypothetical protein